jgi:ABC-type branched-subunit amino acid transport system substrate-binding protein
MNRHSQTGLWLVAVLLAVGLFCKAASAQNEDQQPDPYREALAHFREGRHARAADVLRTALEAGGLGSERASAWLLMAAANLGMDAPQPALSAVAGLDREFPEGPYLLEREWLRGRAHARSGDFLEAARVYARLYANDRDGRLGIAARDALTALAVGSMSDPDVQQLGIDLTGSDLKAWIASVAAEALADRGDLARARRLLDRIESEAPPEGYGAEATERLTSVTERLRTSGPSGFVLGVLAPISGPDADLGEQIVEAVRLAVGGADTEVRYVFRDTGGSLVETARATISLIEDEGAQLIIGPVVNELAVVASSIAEVRDVPIILPHTKSASSPSLGPNVFQLQATMQQQAVALADVAVDSLGMLTFAVLNPISDIGPAYAEAFIARVEEKGGNVIAHQQYFPGTTDFQDQLDSIRISALALSLADTADVAFDDLEAITAANRDSLDRLVPVGSLDALVIPGTGIDSDDTFHIALQADFVWLVTTILGGPAWNSYSVLAAGDYVEGTIFTDTYSVGHTSMQQIDFANRYHAAYGHQPGRASTFTYDAVQLAINAWQLAAGPAQNRAQALRNWLIGVESFEGASGPVNFTRGNRVNDNVYMLQILGERFVPLRITSRVLPATPPPSGKNR